MIKLTKQQIALIRKTTDLVVRFDDKGHKQTLEMDLLGNGDLYSIEGEFKFCSPFEGCIVESYAQQNEMFLTFARALKDGDQVSFVITDAGCEAMKEQGLLNYRLSARVLTKADKLRGEYFITSSFERVGFERIKRAI